MQWYAIDVDPCTGEETERNLQLVQPLGQNAGDIWGRAIFRLGKVNAAPVSKLSLNAFLLLSLPSSLGEQKANWINF